MTISHLSEEEIQQAILEPATCRSELLAHLQSCDDCKAKAVNYQMVFEGLNSLTEVVIDPGLEMSVMDKIAGERAAFKWPEISVGLLSGLAGAAIAALVWFNPQLFSLVISGMRSNMAMLVFFTTVMIAGFCGCLIYKKHTQQMQLLDKL